MFVESSRQRDWGCKLKAKERSGTKLTKLTKWHQVDKVDKVDQVAPSWNKSWQSGTGWHKNWLLEWHQVDTTLTLGKLKAVDQIRKQRLIWDGLTQSKVNIRKTDALKVDITKHAKLCLFCEILLPFVRRIAKTNQAFDGHKFLVSYLNFSFSQRFSYLANQNILNNSLWSPHIRCKKEDGLDKKRANFDPEKSLKRFANFARKKFEKMVFILQRAFACFSCQGVNSLEAAAKQRKADSRLNLRLQPPPKTSLKTCSKNWFLLLLKVPGEVLENYYPMNVTLASRRGRCYI